MPKTPFKKGIANFAKGYATYLGELDIPEDVFLIFKNVSNFFPGKLKKAPKDVKITTTIAATSVPQGGKQYTILYKSDWTIESTPLNEGKAYYMSFIQKTDGETAILLHIASSSDLDSATPLDNSWDYFITDIGWINDDTTGEINPDIFVANGDIRISDGNMLSGNISKWFGHIKRDIWGYNDISGNKDGNDNYLMAPSPGRPTAAGSVNDWRLYDQHIAPPISVKLTSHLDRENNCRGVGEVGIFIQDPYVNSSKFFTPHTEDETGDWTLNHSMDVAHWPDTDKREVFAEEDRYATTFVYDYISESELSRDRYGNLGVGGFPTFAPPLQVIQDSGDEDTVFENQPKYDMDKEQNYIEFTDNDELSRLVGRVIRIGSEKMYVIQDSSNAGEGSIDRKISVVRGVLGTSPQTHVGKEGAGDPESGDTIYFEQVKQTARAASIVVNTGSVGAISLNVDNDLTGGSIENKLEVKLNPALGKTWSENFHVTIDKGVSVPSDEADIFIRRYGSTDEVELVLKQTDLTAGEVIEILNTGTAAGITVNYPGVSTTTQTAAEGMSQSKLLQWIAEASNVGSNPDNSAAADADVTLNFTGGSDESSEWNDRITGVNLYWQPKGDLNWYLVNTYDIKKCLTDEPTSMMKKHFRFKNDVGNAQQTDNENQVTEHFVERSMPQSGNIGAWIEPPFSAPFFEIGVRGAGTEGGVVSTINNAICNRSGFMINPIHVGTHDNYLAASDAGLDVSTVTNMTAVPPGTVVLLSPVGKKMTESFAYPTDSILHSYYGTVTSTNYTDGSLNAATTGDFSCSAEPMSWVGGVVLTDESTGLTFGNISFSTADNSIDLNVSVDLQKYGYSDGDFIFISTDDPGNVVNGLYKINNITAYVTNPGHFTVDTDFRSIPLTGDFPAGNTPIGGAKYFANDLGFALTYGPSHGLGLQDSDGIFAGRVHPIATHGVGSTNNSGCSYAHFIEGFPPRMDAIATRRTPHYGFKNLMYKDILDRGAKDRFKPVRWACSTVINGSAVIGDVDVMDENEQTINERGKILWTPPLKVDEFSSGKSRTIGRIDADPIVALESFNGALVVVKTKDVFICDPASNFREKGVLPGTGTKWKNAVALTGSGVAIANESGIFLVPELQELSIAIRDDYHKMTLDNPVLGYSPKKQELIFIPDTSEKASNERGRFLYSFINKAWSEETCDDPTTSADPSTIGNLFVGDTGFTEYCYDGTAGFGINRIPSTYNDSNGLEITAEDVSHTKSEPFQIKSKKYTFDDPSQTKYIEYIYITYKFGANITMKFYTDGRLSAEFLLPAHYTLKNRKIPVKREGKTFQFEIIQTSSSEQKHFELEDIIFEGFYTGKN